MDDSVLKREQIARKCAVALLNKEWKEDFTGVTGVSWHDVMHFYERNIPRNLTGPEDPDLIKLQKLIICREKLRKHIMTGFKHGLSLHDMHDYYQLCNIEECYFPHYFNNTWSIPPNPFNIHSATHDEGLCMYCNHKGKHDWQSKDNCLYCALEKS